MELMLSHNGFTLQTMKHRRRNAIDMTLVDWIHEIPTLVGRPPWRAALGKRTGAYSDLSGAPPSGVIRAMLNIGPLKYHVSQRTSCYALITRARRRHCSYRTHRQQRSGNGSHGPCETKSMCERVVLLIHMESSSNDKRLLGCSRSIQMRHKLAELHSARSLFCLTLTMGLIESISYY